LLETLEEKAAEMEKPHVIRIDNRKCRAKKIGNVIVEVEEYG